MIEEIEEIVAGQVCYSLLFYHNHLTNNYTYIIHLVTNELF